jgi:transcription initiation factor TFIIIB Brf1 subunit/transcription initiation factor TFIIB
MTYPTANLENCPQCGSEAYGQEVNGTMTCMDCKLGIKDMEDRSYAIQYTHACGYRD